MINKIIEDAYKLYMPQVKSEITDLANLISKQMRDTYPYNVLEIGTKYGGTFYIWNMLMQYHKNVGMCISIDMSDGGLHGGIDESDMDKRDLYFNERFDDCHFIRGDSHVCDTHYKVRDIIHPNTIDFLFIDGDHTYDGVKKDWEMYEPFVKTGGIIAFHDIVISERHHERNVYVGEFWKEELTKFRKYVDGTLLCNISNKWYKMLEFVDGNEDWGGIGVLIKQ